jgi:excinuclease ABC subunit C
MGKDATDTLLGKVDNLPRRPGVYLMKDKLGKILYVGKAVDLRQRVRSYFQRAADLAPKVRALVEKAEDLDYTVTDTEVEALILESNLIKEYRPRYNINLKDDKQYPYLRLTVNEPFPRIHLTRRVERDGARYFGPYTSTGSVRETIRLIRRFFPLRHCHRPIERGKVQRPCLNSHIHRCLAPCTAGIKEEEYHKLVEQVLLFLEGKQDKLLNLLKDGMEDAAANLDFEKAVILRDQCRALEMVSQKQKIVVNDCSDRDILALAASEEQGCVQVFSVRGGRLTGREHFLITNPTGEAAPELMSAFIRRFYAYAGDVPPEILLSVDMPDKELLEQWLKGQRGRRVRLSVPRRGAKKDLVRLAVDNAKLFLEHEELREKVHSPLLALQELARHLHLTEPPYRIEGYDVSHLQGEGTVAAMVVFQGGKPKHSEYRRFRLLTVNGPDDFASLREALSRRFARLSASLNKNDTVNADDPFLLVPDLLLIDGGPGQLSSARQALIAHGYTLPVISLAKEEELIYLPGEKAPLRLPKTSPALQMLQQIRDEAHRFVITYQRKLRTEAKRGSTLLDVPGVGEKRRKALLVHFGGISAIRQASPEELAEVKGMNQVVANRLYKFLHGETVNGKL